MGASYESMTQKNADVSKREHGSPHERDGRAAAYLFDSTSTVTEYGAKL